MKYKPVGKVYSPVAIDYDEGVTITDPETGETYTNEEAKLQSKEIRSRLILKPNKIGCYVIKEWKYE